MKKVRAIATIADPGRAIRGKKKGGLLGEIYQHRVLYLMTLPAIVFFVVFSYIPMVGIYYAFVNYNYADGLFGSPFIGLANFGYLFHGGWDSPIWRLTKNTVLYNLAFIFLGNFLQCFVAILLTEIPSKKYRRVTQSLILLPYFISYVVVNAMAYNILNSEYGALNTLLEAIGMAPVNVYTMPDVWPGILIFVNIWKGLGYGTVVYLAAIMGIDREIYEAAKIDGCNIFQEIRHITLPLLKPTFIMLVLFALGGIMRGQFELFYQLVGRSGQLFVTTDILDTYIYRALTINFNVGLSSASGLFQSLFGFILIVTVNHIVKRENPEHALF